MDPTTVFAIAALVFAYGLVSSRIEGSPITAPMLFVSIGWVLGPHGFDWIRVDGEGVDLVIEVTLVLVLFSDASRIRFSELRRGYSIPARLLAIGMPLTILLGGAFARLFFPELSWAEALLLGAVLAPTDAALGQVVVSSERVPIRIRQALKVESGLNDGVAVPIVMVLLAAAVVGTSESPSEPSGLSFALQQIGLGPVAGVLVAWPAARIVQRAADAGTIARASQHFAGLAMALGAFAAAELLGGNGFIAAFVAGLVLGNTTTTVCEAMQEFAEEEGQLLATMAFLMFGAAMLPPVLGAFDVSVAGYLVLSLTLIRMVPSAIALFGTKLMLPSVGFLGWFGPRGLATILFAILVAEHAAIPHREAIYQVTVLAVGLSTFAHGATAVGRSVIRLDFRTGPSASRSPICQCAGG
ncbi:MAG: cation:proton antiporter [Planctomycetota bacterium]